MFFYNVITELVASQILFLALLEIISLLIAIFVFKIRISSKIILYSAIIAFILSLLSVVVVRGNYGGMAYHERFGWPFQYHNVSRDMEGSKVAIPYQTNFDSLRFFTNTVFWWFISLISLVVSVNKKKNMKASYFLAIALLVFISITLLFSYKNHLGEKELNTGEPSVKTNGAAEYQNSSNETNICISIFSGMPDPCVDLTEEQTVALVEKIESLPKADNSAYIPDIGLGYRGITGNLANNLDLSTDKSFIEFHVFDGLVAYNPNQKAIISSMSYTDKHNPNLVYKVDENRELEKWLISLIAVDAKTQKLVEELLQELK